MKKQPISDIKGKKRICKNGAYNFPKWYIESSRRGRQHRITDEDDFMGFRIVRNKDPKR